MSLVVSLVSDPEVELGVASDLVLSSDSMALWDPVAAWDLMSNCAHWILLDQGSLFDQFVTQLSGPVRT